MQNDNPQIHEFIEHQRRGGLDDAAIADKLRASGWPDDLIGHALGGTSYAQAQNHQAIAHPPTGQAGFWTGRIGRLGYVMVLVYFLLFMAIPVAVSLLFRMASVESPLINIIIILWGMIGVLASIPISIAIQIKRWHDLDQSGWLTLLGLVPFVGFITSVILLVMPGTSGPNKYGAPHSGKLDPKSVLGLR